MFSSRDYEATRHAALKKTHMGLDRIVHAAVGRYRRRASLNDAMLAEAESVAARSLRFRHESENRLRDMLREYQALFRRRGKGYERHVPEAMAVMAEASARTLGLRPFPVQIMGALALYRGCLAEMATGEGKSLTACFPAILAAWTGRPCHIVTVNDYLAGRDAEAFRPFHAFCGATVGAVLGSMDSGERREHYGKGVVYTTSKEILADFLRDRLRRSHSIHPSRRAIQRLREARIGRGEDFVMRGLHTAIVDEADSVLIDEAVTPLIISQRQPNNHLREACLLAGEIARSLAPRRDYVVDPRYREIRLTEKGREKIGGFCSSLPGIWQGPSRREEIAVQALLAKEFFHRDKEYVIHEGKVVIVDEFTGRLMPLRTWKEGLHQAVEAKEELPLSDPSETLARMSFQRFFRLFDRLCGMTGTAAEAAAEFWHIHELSVLAVPTHRPCIRKELPDRIFPNGEMKWRAVVEEIARLHRDGRPVLVGTRSVEASEGLAAMLEEKNLPFNLLNAVRHREEAAIVAGAGARGAITIATNMAGRGTDIRLGPGVAELGGLHVIATERHASRRIDRQLFGRSARQGDPGSAQAYVGIDDELLRRFAPVPLRRLLAALVEKDLPGAGRIAARILNQAQNEAQRLAFRQRRAVLRQDEWLDDSLAFAGRDAG